MSRLVLKGNTIKNFGKHLPVPYIERIEIATHPNPAPAFYQAAMAFMSVSPSEPEDWAGVHSITTLTVKTCLMFNTSDDFLLEDFKAQILSDYHINFFLVSSPVDAAALKKSKRKLKETIESLSATPSRIVSIPLSDFAMSETFTLTEERDAQYNRIIKTSNIVGEFYFLEKESASEIEASEDLAVFACTSIEPMGTVIDYTDVVYALNFSDVAYETIVKQGNVVVKNSDGYFDLAGGYYTDIPILGLSNRYYKTENYGFNEIVTAIQSVTDPYQEYRYRNKNIDTVLNNIAFVLSKYQESPELIVQLNKLSNMFPHTAESQRINRIHHNFKVAVNNANALLMEQPEVVKKLLRNAKIQDYRPFGSTFDGEPGVYDSELEDDESNFMYPVILQSNLAKFEEVDEGSSAAEVPYSAESLYTAMVEAMHTELKKIPSRTGSYIADRIAAAMGDPIQDAAKQLTFEIDNFIEWIQTSPTGLDRGIAEDHLGMGDLEIHGYTNAAIVVGADNAPQLAAAKALFGTKNAGGAPSKPTTINKCTLEVGWVYPNANNWEAAETAYYGFDSIWDASGIFKVDKNPFNAPDFDYASAAYRVLLDVENTGKYMNRIEENIQESLFGTGGADSVLADMDFYGIFEQLLTPLLGPSSVTSGDSTPGGRIFAALNDVDVWERINTKHELVDESGNFSDDALQGMINKWFGRSNGELGTFGQRIEEYARATWSYHFQKARGTVDVDGEDLGQLPSSGDLRLRWCPCSDADVDDSADWASYRELYGGWYSKLWSDRLPAAGNWWSQQGATFAKPYTADGILGRLPGNSTIDMLADITAALKNVWTENFRPLVKEYIKTVIPWIADYHGVTLGSGRHRKLANVNIVVQKYGWAFFDMEKYIMYQSEISKYLDPAKLEEFLPYGRDMLNDTIRLKRFQFHRRDPEGAAHDDQTEVTLKVVNGSLLQQGPVSPVKATGTCSTAPLYGAPLTIKALEVFSWRDFAATTEGELVADGESVPASRIFAHVIPRNVDFPDSAIVPDNYRLMAFNFNYFLDDDLANEYGDRIETQFKLEDNSLKIIYHMSDLLREQFDKLTEYYELAKENCAYNRFDSEFNVFFKQKMLQQYEDNPSAAPWVTAAAVFATYSDLYMDAYSGDYFTALDEARKIMDSINPETGWLDGLEIFYNQFVSLLSQFENNTSGAAGVRTKSYTSITTRPAGNIIDYHTDAEDFGLPVLPRTD